MRIFLVRHGEAAGHLTSLGKAQVIAAANVLKQQDIDPELTLLASSPLLRAVQSGNILSEQLGLSEPLQKEWLALDRSFVDHASTLFQPSVTSVTTVIAVSHMPGIEETLEHFASLYNINFRANAGNGSVHLVNLDMRSINRLFPQ